MTDERPAEPDISGLMQEVEHFGECCFDRGNIPSKYGPGGRREDDAPEARIAVEAAARSLAIEYAESRVRACRNGDGTLPMPLDTVGVTENVIAELAALARLKGTA